MTLVIFAIINKLGLNKAKIESQRILEDAKSSRVLIEKRRLKQELKSYEIKLEAEKELKSRHEELLEIENKLSRRR